MCKDDAFSSEEKPSNRFIDNMELIHLRIIIFSLKRISVCNVIEILAEHGKKTDCHAP